MKRLFLLLLITPCFNFVFAQKIEIIVIDASKNSPVQGATISIYSTTLELKNKRLPTDQQGKAIFSLTNSVSIDSIIVESYMYEKKVLRNINVITDTIIYTQIQYQPVKIEEVQIGIRSGTSFSNNKIIYFPHPSEFNKTRSITELIPMIPNLTSRNGNYFFRNDGNFIILIDGLGENKNKEEQLKILENMPVDAIHRVEIIDNPSARYGNGVVAVINFMTKQDVAYSSLRSSATKQVFHGGEHTNSPNSLNISGDSRFRLNKNNLHFTVRKGINNSLQENSIEQSFLNNSVEQKNYMNRNIKNSYYSFTLDKKFGQNLSGQISANYTANNGQNKGVSDIRLSGNNNEWTKTSTNNIEQLKDHRFVFNPQLKYHINNEIGTTLYMNPTYAFISLFENNMYIDSRNDSPVLTNTSILSSETEIYFIDLIVDNILNKKLLQTSLGYKYNFLRNNQIEGGSFNYKEHQNTLFITNSVKLKKTTINADFRMEYLDYSAMDKDTSTNHKDFLFYPKVNLVYSISNQKNISIGYERQFLRLGSIALNSNIRYNGYLSGTKGNIELQPRITNYYFSRLYLHGHSISISFKKHQNHRIFIPISEEEPYITEQTSYNYFRQFYITYNKDFKISSFWTANMGAYYYMNRMKSTDFDFVNTKDNNIMLDLSNELTFGKNNTSLAFSYMSPNHFEYGEGKALVYNIFTYNRLFFNNTLGLSFSINDFLGITREHQLLVHPYITNELAFLTNQRKFSVQLSYRFPAGKKSRNGNYKTDRKDEIRI